MKQHRYLTIALFLLAACGPRSQPGDDGNNQPCPGRCTELGWEQCLSPGVYADPVLCDEGQTCSPEAGCDVCFPGAMYCAGEDGNEIWSCNAEGTEGVLINTCPSGQVCSYGVCKTPCERAQDLPSNVGCHFWAVDLDNEAVSSPVSNDAAAQQYAVAIANSNPAPVTVRVYRNVARVGEAIEEELVLMRSVAPNSLEQIDLPQREVDGTMGQNGNYAIGSGSGTFVSPHAYRIEASEPVVAYQFNPIIQQFSNDASILIPIQALGRDYSVLGWPTANPCGPPPGDPFYNESIPDHTSVTIVGVEDNTTVTVVPTHPIAPSGGDSGLTIQRTLAGNPVQFTINRYDVVNLSSDQPQVSIFQCLNFLDQDGDFTGTTVQSNKPVAVFSSLERGAGLGGAEPPEPPGWDGTTCCTDHLEQQMFPTEALGWEFAVSRSPVRSTDPGYQEPDLYRVLATVDGTVVTTNLPAPNNMLSLDRGQFATFHADSGFTLSASGGAIMVGQYLVSQGYIPQGGIGDPTFVVFPASEQHREEYVFLVPTTFAENYMVLAMPETAAVQVDGQPLGEFNNCVTGDIGTIGIIQYTQLTCPMPEGVHTVSANMPVGLTVYGYYNVGSYGYPGGSDVRIINPIE